MKNGLKIGLIIGGSLLVVGGAWAGLTKIGIIPNWFDIEVLCSCVDCNGKEFYEGNIPQINGTECCEGTYRLDKYQPITEKNTIIDSENRIIINSDCLNGVGKDCFNYHKPIIYLYPTDETEVNVKLGTPQNLLHTYPKYDSKRGRNVIVQPNGDLEDMNTGRKLYALYREGKISNSKDFDEGFVVAGEDIIPFLEEKLAILGLNERESDEFIVYRLPQMENNEWNLIRFETIEEQNKNMPLNITPTPDTVIRVMMDWKAIDEPIDIPEQQLITSKRDGFTVVEWGGSLRN